MEEEEIKLELPRDILSIYEGEPDDNFKERVKSPEINNKDFEEPEEIEIEEETTDNIKTKDPEIVDFTNKRAKELSEKSKDLKKQIVQLIKPSRVIMFADMMISKSAPMLATRTTAKDWKLDPEDKEWLASILDVMIEEEGIEFWPAKVWLIIGIIFIYGMKTQDIYTKYYTAKGLETTEPHLLLEQKKAEALAHTANMEALLLEAEMLEKEAEVKARIVKSRLAIENGRTLDEQESANFHKTISEQTEAMEPDPEPEQNNLKGKKGHYTVNKAGDVFDHKDYSPNDYSYKDGFLFLKLDGTPRKVTGGFKTREKYRNKETGQMMKKADYMALYHPEKTELNGNDNSQVEEAQIIEE